MLIGWSGNKTDPFDLTSLTLDELTVLGTLGFCWDFPVALRMMAQGSVRTAPLISHRFPLQQVDKGIRLLQTGQDQAWKVVIE